MAYAGTTSTSPNPPALSQMALAGRQDWTYNSTHTQAEAAAAGFFTDARDLGMRFGDSVKVLGSTTGLFSYHTVSAITSTGATLNVGHLVSSAS